LLQSINQTKTKKNEVKYLDSIEKAKRDNFMILNEKEVDYAIGIESSNQELFRESAGDMMPKELNEILTEEEISTQMETYLEANLDSNQEDLNTILKNLKLEKQITETDKSDKEAIELINKVMIQQKKLDLSNFLESQECDEETVDFQEELLNLNMEILKNEKELEGLDYIDEEYKRVKLNIEQMYYRI